MTLTQLRAFLVALDHGTFTAAAQELQVSQASVSELIVRLESELDTSLFTRSSRRLVPTSAAEELAAHARRTIRAAEDTVEAMRSLTSLESGVATFGAARNAHLYGLTNLVQEFHTQHPGVRIRMIGLNSYGVAQSVNDGEVEAGLVVLPVPFENLRYEPLLTDEVLFATAGPRPRDGLADLHDLADAGMVLYDAHSGWNDPTRRQLLNRAQSQGMRLAPAIEVEQVDSALALVSAGMGATVVSGSLVRAGRLPANVEAYPFEDPLRESVALVSRNDAPISRATREIMAVIRRLIVEPPLR
ncbi:LysR family transcriptional regulator [Citricoccus sp.]|uniref:LysR family transcriptional regulator n=1 Tax=Citricoccus sp. TaxID=1978372 RepID=UPI0028BE93D0|nr:LysR family transcriptional regulator [Citricoccus sp.]